MKQYLFRLRSLALGLLTILACLLLRHEQDPLQDLNRPGQDDQDQDQAGS